MDWDLKRGFCAGRGLANFFPGEAAFLSSRRFFFTGRFAERGGFPEGEGPDDFLVPCGFFLGTEAPSTALAAEQRKKMLVHGLGARKVIGMDSFPPNKSSKTPFFNHPSVQAFTLIELLVVIAIIAILASLLMPAMNSALNSAKKATAKQQATSIATAIIAYETEYGRLPANSGGSNVDATLVTTLCTTNDASNNPRGLIFMEASAWKQGKGGTNSSGFADPFNSTSIYSVALDTNYANSLSLPTQTNAGSAITTTTTTKHVGVWTVWTNGTKTFLIDSWD